VDRALRGAGSGFQPAKKWNCSEERSVNLEDRRPGATAFVMQPRGRLDSRGATMQPFTRLRSRSSSNRENALHKISIALAAGVAALGSACAAAQAPDARARSLAATCAACHGTNGISVGDVDSLAGKAKDELARKLQEFKSGARPGTVMPQLAKGYTDEQIDTVATWFAAQKPK